MMNVSIKKIFPALIAAAAVLTAMIFFLLSPARYTQSVRDGISLWAVSVLPATFPFLFLTALFTRFRLFDKLSRILSRPAGKIFRVSGAGGCAAVLSMLSGYPVGARSVLDLYESDQVSEKETFRLACLCSTTGPMFLVGVVGTSMYRNPALGWVLLAAHYIGVLSVCFVLRFTAKPNAQNMLPVRKPQSGNLLFDSLYQSVISILCVGGAIAVFYAFGQMLSDLGAFLPLGETAEAVLRGLLEMTSGCSLVSGTPSPLSAALCAFFITFGGLCVLVQQIAWLGRARVKIPPFIAVKALQGFIAAACAYGLSLTVL